MSRWLSKLSKKVQAFLKYSQGLPLSKPELLFEGVGVECLLKGNQPGLNLKEIPRKDHMPV